MDVGAPERAMLRQSVTDFMRREAPAERITRLRRAGSAYDPELYATAAELGWLGVAVPEADGGMALSMADCAVLFEAFGRGPLPGPFFSSAILASLLLVAGTRGQVRADRLGAMVEGALRVVVTTTAGGPAWDAASVACRLEATGGGYRLAGRERFVRDAEAADAFICAARLAGSGGEAIALVLVDRAARGVAVIPREGMLLTGVADVTFTDVVVPASALVGEIGQGWQLLDEVAERALPILCAFMVGGCEQIRDETLVYTRERFAFGQAIGRFQRVQDHMVELANQADGAHLLTDAVLAEASGWQPSPAGAHEAKAVASEAYYQAVNHAHMVHAGPGTDLDHPLMSHTILSRQLFGYLGDPWYHKRRMLDLMYPATGEPRRVT